MEAQKEANAEAARLGRVQLEKNSRDNRLSRCWELFNDWVKENESKLKLGNKKLDDLDISRKLGILNQWPGLRVSGGQAGPCLKRRRV